MNKLKMKLSLLLLGSMLLAGPVLADTLVDYGYQVGWAAPSFAVSNASQEYQSFEVTDAEGWTISSMGLWSGLVQDPNGVGMLGRILADNAGAPDESTVLAEEIWTITGDLYGKTMDYQAYDIFLPQGTYWIHCLTAGEVTDYYSAVIGGGTSGPSRWWRDVDAGTPPFEIAGSASLALVVEGTIGETVATQDRSWSMVKSLYRD